jgi:hypothetical protein
LSFRYSFASKTKRIARYGIVFTAAIDREGTGTNYHLRYADLESR